MMIVRRGSSRAASMLDIVDPTFVHRPTGADMLAFLYTAGRTGRQGIPLYSIVPQKHFLGKRPKPESKHWPA
jgi:hypothetical protein